MSIAKSIQKYEDQIIAETLTHNFSVRLRRELGKRQYIELRCLREAVIDDFLCAGHSRV